MSPEKLFLDHLPLIERVVDYSCRRYHFRPEEAEDFASIVKLKLIDDDYGVLRQFQGKSKIETYLTVVVQRLLLDHLNRMWGKWRPSAEAKRIGPLAIQLERLLRRDGHSLDEACQILRTNHGVKESPQGIADIAAKLPPRLPRRIEGEEELANLPAPDGSPEERVREQEREAGRARTSAALTRALAQLPDEDRLIARMRAEFRVVEIAKHLRQPEKPLYRRIEKIFQKLRRAMEREGIDHDDILEFLGEK